MPHKKQRYRATVAGKTYTILGTKSHHHMHSVIKLVNEQWDELTTLSKEMSDTQKAILLAINAVSIQLEKQVEIEQLKKELEAFKTQSQGKGTRRKTISQSKRSELEEQLATQEDLIRR